MTSRSRKDSRPTRLNAPGSQSAKNWSAEEKIIGPGLQAVVQWARISIQSAEKAQLIDVDGNEYIDLMGGGGVNSIGHSHPRYVKSLTEQLQRWMVGGFSSPSRGKMLRLVKRMMPAKLNRIQLYSGGAEAVEAAQRLAKSYTGGYEFVSFWGGYHGKTLGALALTPGGTSRIGPSPGGYLHAPYAYCYRCPLGLTYPSCEFECVEFTRRSIRQSSNGQLAGIVVEPVQGRMGNIVPPDGYMAALADVAREFSTLLIADESLTGFGRAGDLLASFHDGVVPDIAIVGKGMGGGYPVSGIISSSLIMSKGPFAQPSASSSSYGGYPLACEAVWATLKIVSSENLIERSKRLGAEMLTALKSSLEGVSIVGDVRGRGLALGIELVSNKETREPIDSDLMRAVFLGLLEHGVVVMVGGSSLRLYPPLNIEESTAFDAVDRIAYVLRTQPWRRV